MKPIIVKQLVQWKEELAKHVETRNQAQKVLEEETKTILLIEGGIQAKEMLLKKIESSDQPTGIVELNQQSKTTPLNLLVLML